MDLDSNVEVSKIHIGKENEAVGAASVDNVDEEMTEGSTKLNGIVGTLVSHGVIDITIGVVVNETRPSALLVH